MRGLPLQWKLPLLMTGVLLVVLAGGVLVVDRELRRAAEVVNGHQLQEFSRSIADLIETSRSRTLTRMREVASNAAVVRSLEAGRIAAPDRSAVSTALARLRTPDDSGHISELWGADGTVIATVGDSAAYRGRPSTAAVTIGLDALSIGSFYTSDGHVYYWNSIPVIADGRRIGTLAERRRINNEPAIERNFTSLSRQHARILLHSADGLVWTTLGGRELPPPTNPRIVHGLSTYDHPQLTPTERVVLAEARPAGTPWVVAVELPLSALRAGPRDLLGRFAIMSLLLLLIGAIAVWIISRRVTSPLAKLTAAAEAMARGDYSHRVEETGGYELALLGSGFNRMATEVEAAQQNLRAAADAAAGARAVAEDANAAKANFLAAVSHELRTPLNAIAGYVDLLEMGLRGPLTTEQQTDIARIRRSQQYLLGLIEQILVFAQLEARRVAINLQDVSVDEVMRDAEAMVEPQIRARGIDYSYAGCHPGLVIRADREKTQQIVLNLLTNAAKYTSPGGRLSTSCEMRNGSVHVRVSDTGAGIPETMLSRIFEPFVQLDRSLNRPREGVGLGLTISRDLARAMGGDLFAESTVGVGSTFTLVLPRTKGQGNI
jgi:signal transduction histidine kinase